MSPAHRQQPGLEVPDAVVRQGQGLEEGVGDDVLRHGPVPAEGDRIQQRLVIMF